MGWTGESTNCGGGGLGESTNCGGRGQESLLIVGVGDGRVD